MPRWLCWWGEQDAQEAVNVAELLEQVERQRAIIEEQARQIKQAEQVVSDANEYLEALRAWLDAVPKNKKEVTNVI